MPDAHFEVNYAKSGDPRFRAAIHVLRAPETMLAGDIAGVLVSIHNGSSRPLRPDSDRRRPLPFR
jgi:hypothetical protein